MPAHKRHIVTLIHDCHCYTSDRARRNEEAVQKLLAARGRDPELEKWVTSPPEGYASRLIPSSEDLWFWWRVYRISYLCRPSDEDFIRILAKDAPRASSPERYMRRLWLTLQMALGVPLCEECVDLIEAAGRRHGAWPAECDADELEEYIRLLREDTEQHPMGGDWL